VFVELREVPVCVVVGDIHIYDSSSSSSIIYMTILCDVVMYIIHDVGRQKIRKWVIMGISLTIIINHPTHLGVVSVLTAGKKKLQKTKSFVQNAPTSHTYETTSSFDGKSSVGGT